MKIAVLSGKGGTGKTLVSVNMAAAAKSSVYIDCDVEEPNGYLFFKPQDVHTEQISVEVPRVDMNKCDGCRACTEFCKFNAIAYAKDKLIIFDEVCHSCGGCVMLCTRGALKDEKRVVGLVKKGVSDKVSVHTGILNTGESSGIPVISRLLDEVNNISDKDVIIDCPPGSACSVMESIKGADYCILVAEPTVFGSSNLRMVYELTKLFKKPFGVVLNKCIDIDNPSKKFCIDNNIKILEEIPFDKELGLLNSNAEIAVRKSEKYKLLFTELLDKVRMEVQHEAASNTKW